MTRPITNRNYPSGLPVLYFDAIIGLAESVSKAIANKITREGIVLGFENMERFIDCSFLSFFPATRRGVMEEIFFISVKNRIHYWLPRSRTNVWNEDIN